MVDLASHDEIAIFPVGGWWELHTRQKRMNNKGALRLGHFDFRAKS